MALEQLLLLRSWQTDQPQVFIVGLPRSGTTLIYQAIVHRMAVAYFAHGDGVYHAFPLTASLVTRSLRGHYQSDFTSDYGKSHGSAAPHEAGGFWNRQFGAEAYVRYAELSPAVTRRLQRTVCGLQALSGNRPFVNKNVKHLLRIDALAGVFPAAVFVVVQRDPQDVALSILRGRYKNLGDAAGWWSVRPPDYDQIKDLPPAQQVARQVLSLTQRLEHDLGVLDPARVIRVGYEDFCQRPEQLIDRLVQRLPGVGLTNTPLSAFPVNHNTPRTAEETQLIEALAHEST